MGKIFVYIVIITFSSFKAVYAQLPLQEPDQINIVISDLKKLIENNSIKNEDVAERFLIFEQKAASKEILFTEKNDTVNKFGRFRLIIDSDNTGKLPTILINTNILSLYKEYPAYIYTQIIEQVYLLSEYFTDKNKFAEDSKDPFNNMFRNYALLKFTAVFIDDYLADNNFTLAPFDLYLYDCFLENKISSAFRLYSGADIKVLHYIWSITEDKDLSYAEAAEEIIYWGEFLLDNFYIDENDEEWAKYVELLKLYTYYNYSWTAAAKIGTASYSPFAEPIKKLNEEIKQILADNQKILLFRESILDSFTNPNKWK